MPETQRILSIQSHVASGYVGNRAATFPLQYLGYDVDVINSCQLSCHTGYDTFPGHRLSADQLDAVFVGLEANDLCNYDRILTGYVPGGEALGVVAKRIRALKAKRGSMIYLLDPVMGDSGRLYVQPDTIEVYKEMLDLATIITPNEFELELLFGAPVTSSSSLIAALHHIHTERKVPNIVISSSSLRMPGLRRLSAPDAYTKMLPDPLPTEYSPADADQSALLCIASSWSDDKHSLWAFPLPTIRTSDFTGVGDFFSAMVLAHYHPLTLDPLRFAVARATLLVQQLLLRTFLSSIPGGAEAQTEQSRILDPEEKARWVRRRELKLVQSADLLTASGEWPSQLLDLKLDAA